MSDRISDIILVAKKTSDTRRQPITENSPSIPYTDKYKEVSKGIIESALKKYMYVVAEFIATAIRDFQVRELDVKLNVIYVRSWNKAVDDRLLGILKDVFKECRFIDYDEYRAVATDNNRTVVVFLGYPLLDKFIKQEKVSQFLKFQEKIVESLSFADRYGVFFSIPWKEKSITYYEGELWPAPFAKKDSSLCYLWIPKSRFRKKYCFKTFDDKMFRYRVCDRDDNVTANSICQLIIEVGGDPKPMNLHDP